MKLVRAAFLFIALSFVYTVIFYVGTPFVFLLLDCFQNNIDTSGWTSQAQSTWSTIITVTRYSWVWGCVLSFISTLIWYYLTPYREEVMTDVYG